MANIILKGYGNNPSVVTKGYLTSPAITPEETTSILIDGKPVLEAVVIASDKIAIFGSSVAIRIAPGYYRRI